MCGRLQTKIEELKSQHWDLLGVWDQDTADKVEREQEKYGELLAIAECRRGNPDAAEVRSRNPVPGRHERTCRETRVEWKKNGLQWQSELKEAS